MWAGRGVDRKTGCGQGEWTGGGCGHVGCGQGCVQTPLPSPHTKKFCQQAAGMYITGMLSCFLFRVAR